MSGVALIGPALRDAALQLGDRRILRVIALALGLMLLLTGPFLAIFLAFAGFLEWLLPASIEVPWVGQLGFLGILTQGLASKTAWIFWTYVMSPLALAIVGALLEPIVDAVERRHYPALARVRNRGVVAQVVYGVRFLGLTLAVSLGALIISLVTPLPAAAIFVAANGYLIAREYYETVALRRQSPGEAAAGQRAALPVSWTLGALVALGMTVPFVNLLAPVIGAAAFTHLFHRLGGRRPRA